MKGEMTDSEVNEIIEDAFQMMETMKAQGMNREDFNKALSLEIGQSAPDCPICGEGVLTAKVEINEGTELHYSVCDTCGSEQANSEQVKRNKLLKEARKLI